MTTPFYAPAWGFGGPPRLVHELAQRLVRKGHDVRVFASDVLDVNERIPTGEQELDGVRVCYFRTLQHEWAVRPRNRILILRGYLSSLKKALRQTDVVHIFGTRDYVSLGACLMAQAMSVPYALSAVGTLGRPSHGWKRVIAPVVDRLFIKPMLRGAATLIAQTVDEQELYQTSGGDANRVALVPLGVDGIRCAQFRDHGKFRKLYGIESGAKLVLFLGRIHHNKGLDLLLEAVAGLRDEEPTLRVAVVGRDDGAQSFCEGLARRMGLDGIVRFVGPLYESDAIAAYADADLFVLTSRHPESSPLAALEACACGTQVVLTQEAAIPLARECGAGEIVPCSVSHIREALRVALSWENIARRGAAAREMVRQHFDWDVVLELYEAIYHRIREVCVRGGARRPA